MTLAETGLEIHRRHAAAPELFQVMGERSSGTHFVSRLLAKNTALTPTEAYGWKHGFAQMTGIGKRSLIIGVARDPIPWVLSMHRKPWHCPPAMQALGFSDFLRAPWETVIDRKRYFEGAGALGSVSTPLIQDRHPVNGRPFAHIAELRSIKAAYLLGFRNRGCNLVLCRLGEVQDDPEGFVARIAAAFDLEKAPKFAPVTKRLGSRFLSSVDPRPDTPSEVGADDRAFLAQTLSREVEAAWGFAPPA